jgi:hypothetical protein
MIPSFQADGLLPPGDYEVSFEELRRSMLTVGPGMAIDARSWDAPWRERLVDNFEVLTRQLWSVGVRDVFADGSFVEDKDHPNDIDGYFVCGLTDAGDGHIRFIAPITGCAPLTALNTRRHAMAASSLSSRITRKPPIALYQLNRARLLD